MIIQIERKQLLKTLTGHKNIADKKHKLPILRHVKLSVLNGLITITSTNLDISKISTLIADISGEGLNEICLNCKELMDIIKNIKEPVIKLDIKDDLKVKINDYIGLQGIHIEEYPVISQDETPKESFTVDTKKLQECLKKNLLTVNIDSPRPAFHGVQFLINNNTLQLNSSDGHTLYTHTIPITQSITTSFVLHHSTIKEILKLEDESLYFETLTQQVNEESVIEKVKIVCSNNTLTTRIINSKFPDVTQVMPEKFDYNCNIPDEGKDIINLISKKEKDSGGKITFDNNTITISDLNDSIVKTIKNDNWNYPAMTIGLNFNYLSKFLEFTNQIFFNDYNHPVCVKDTLNCFLLMPLRLKEQDI